MCSNVKCHKCRHLLIDDLKNVSIFAKCQQDQCRDYFQKFLYISEVNTPVWIKTRIEAEEWTKGKLHCNNCGNRIGSFDFVSGRKCVCGRFLLPFIHLVASQIDIPIINAKLNFVND